MTQLVGFRASCNRLTQDQNINIAVQLFLRVVVLHREDEVLWHSHQFAEPLNLHVKTATLRLEMIKKITVEKRKIDLTTTKRDLENFFSYLI